MSKATELKDRYHEEVEKSMANGNGNTVYTFGMIAALRDMAENDVYPDGTFGDIDCNVWSMFKGKG